MYLDRNDTITLLGRKAGKLGSNAFDEIRKQLIKYAGSLRVQCEAVRGRE